MRRKKLIDMEYSTPATQTLCNQNGATLTVMSVLPTQTEIDVDYVTANTEVTVWVGCVCQVPAFVQLLTEDGIAKPNTKQTLITMLQQLAGLVVVGMESDHGVLFMRQKKRVG